MVVNDPVWEDSKWMYTIKVKSEGRERNNKFEEDVLWPLEKPTWTSGAVLLAADALSQYTTASRLFIEVDSREQPKLGRRHRQA